LVNTQKNCGGKMKYAVIGSRNFKDWFYFCQIMPQFIPETIISGGAIGADSFAAKYAKMKNIPLVEFIPDWEKHGKSAGFKRNVLIVSAADEVIAFWDGKSAGTRHSIDIAKNQGKKVHVFWKN